MQIVFIVLIVISQLMRKKLILNYIFYCFQIILLLLPVSAVISYNFEYFTRKYYFVV